MNRFRPRETDTNPMNMLEAAVRDEVPNVTYAKGAAAACIRAARGSRAPRIDFINPLTGHKSSMCVVL